MLLLFLYLSLAIGVSFVCSLCEAALLSLGPSEAEVMAREGRGAGKTLAKLKKKIDRPLAAILTLNTVAHTVGAAGVGAESARLYGDAWIGLTSAVLTLAILVLSEIIPKTLGALHARRLATPVTWMVVGMIWITYPVVVSLDALSNLLKRGSKEHVLSRAQMEVIAEMATRGGALRGAESAIMGNILRIRDVKVHEVMTPRTVVFMIDLEDTAQGVLDANAKLRFTRIPVRGESMDDVRGFVLKSDLYEAVIRGRGETRAGSLLRTIRATPESGSLLGVMENFAKTGDHMFLVVDEYGGTSGIISLEDVLETILGAEIVDETDAVADMRLLTDDQSNA